METKKGNLLDLEKGFIVHGCNAQGSMGAGIALQIRHKWPIVYNDYRVRYLMGHCNDEGLKLPEIKMGDIIPVEVTPELCVINAITQRYYTGHPKSTGGVEVDYVAMAYAFSEINLLPEQYPNIEPVLNFPLIGAGLAKGDWDIIASIIDDFCPNFQRVLWIYDT